MIYAIALYLLVGVFMSCILFWKGGWVEFIVFAVFWLPAVLLILALALSTPVKK